MPAEFDNDEVARSQRFEQRLRDALEDVPVPVGLAERMLTALDANSLDALATEVKPSVALPPAPPLPRRRSWFGMAVAIAAVLLVGTMYGWLNRGPALGIAETLLAESTSVLQSGESVEWDSNLADPKLAKFPWDRWLKRQPQQWRSTQLAGDSAVIYDLAPEGGAVLVVVTTRKDYRLPATPPTTLRSASSSASGVSTTAWQQPTLVYVLAVDSRRRHDPQDFLKASKLAQTLVPGPQALARR